MQFPFLPVSCVLDILFRFEGIVGLDRVLQHKLCRFFECNFGENFPSWTEIVCTTILVWKMEHPSNALYLLHPEDDSVMDSQKAWCVCKTLRFHSKSHLMQAMQRLLPSAPFVIYDWLDLVDLKRLRSSSEWELFSSKCIENHRFTNEWHAENGPGHMRHIIPQKAKTELQQLEESLFRFEWDRLASIRKHDKISFSDQQYIRYEASQQFTEHLRILAEVRKLLLDDISTNTLDSNFPYVAGVVMSIAKKYPCILWNLKLRVHEEAEGRLGLSTWYIERTLCRPAATLRICPVHALRRLAKK